MCDACREHGRKAKEAHYSIEDFADPIRVRHPKRKRKEKKMRGCPGNEFGPHIYAWTVYVSGWLGESNREFFERNHFYRREYYVCVGCEKISKSRYTAEFQKLLTKAGRR